MTRSQNDVAGEYSDVVNLTQSEYHRLLTAARRRHALAVLLDRSAPVDLADLAATVAEREDGMVPEDEGDVERVRTTLHHVHLPMLDDHDLLTYDVSECQVVSCPVRTDPPVR